jgi:LuxR family maltose regulon positive regulatory protein
VPAVRSTVVSNGPELLALPRQGRRNIDRRRLSDLLDRITDTGVVLVSAGAGHGKTTALSSWASQLDDVALAWVSCREEHNDPPRLAAAVAAALHLEATPTFDDLTGAIEASDATTLVVFDDAHRLSGEVIWGEVDRLLERRPSNLWVVVSGRDETGVHWHRLRARGEVTEIRGPDLDFTSVEATALLAETFGVENAAEVVGPLIAATRGWATGLCLAGHALREAGARRLDTSELGRHRYVRGYFDDELLVRLPDDVVRFLEVTCLLDRLDPQLCDLLTDRSDSHALLERFVDDNLFTEQVSTLPVVFRYHQLFADYLRSRANGLGPLDRAEHLARASRWYEDQRLPDLAIEAALRAGDVHRAEVLIRRASADVLRAGSARTLLRWLSSLPQEALEVNPDLALLVARSAGGVGDLLTARAGVGAVDAHLRSTPEPEPTLLLARHGLAFLIATWTGDLVSAKSDLEIAEAVAAEHDIELRRNMFGFEPVDLGAFRATWHLLNGELDDAIRLADAILSPSQLVRPSKGAILALGVRALARLWRGDSSGGARAVEESRPVVEAFPGRIGGMLGFYVAAAWSGEGQQAESDLARAREIVVELRQPLHRVLYGLGEAQVKLRAGRWKDARASLDAVRTATSEMASGGFLETVAWDLREQIEATASVDAEISINDRELAVLEQIAAGASRREAAEQLYLSVNTVKTHLRSAYRKLAASTREDAIARARALGVLDPPTS